MEVEATTPQANQVEERAEAEMTEAVTVAVEGTAREGVQVEAVEEVEKEGAQVQRRQSRRQQWTLARQGRM